MIPVREKNKSGSCTSEALPQTSKEQLKLDNHLQSRAANKQLIGAGCVRIAARQYRRKVGKSVKRDHTL